MAVEITEFLLSAQSADAKHRTEAESSLEQFQEQNLPGFLLSLSVELSNDGKPTESRRLTGIVLKNSLDAKDVVRKVNLVQQWVAIDISFKAQIKGLLLNTLAATKALCNALDFAQTNFENEMERNYIMKMVCETAMAKETQIKQAAFECLVSIASTYYEVSVYAA